MADNKLSEIKVRQAKPKDKMYGLTDGAGLRVLLKHNGMKAWQFTYRINGKQKTLSLGLYPDVTLRKRVKCMTISSALGCIKHLVSKNDNGILSQCGRLYIFMAKDIHAK